MTHKVIHHTRRINRYTYLLTAQSAHRAQDRRVCWAPVIGDYDWYHFPCLYSRGEPVEEELRALNPLCLTRLSSSIVYPVFRSNAHVKQRRQGGRQGTKDYS